MPPPCPLAVLFIAILAAEVGKAVSKQTRIDILATPAVTIFTGVVLAYLIAPPIGSLADAFGTLINQTTMLQPFWMGIAVSVLVGAALTLPISSAAFHWAGLILVCFILLGLLSWLFCELLRRVGWIKEGDLTLPQ